MTIETLFARAGVDTWNKCSWFKGAELKGGTYLYVTATPDVFAYIQRNFLPAFQQHIPTLELRQQPPALRPVPSKYAGAIKPGKWRDALDLLDS